MRWSTCRLVAFDTETTGLNPHDGDRIIEFAAVEFTLDGAGGVAAVQARDFLINPEMPIPRKSTQVTGISDEHVAGKPPFAARAQEVHRLLADAIIVAHNLPFDLGFLRAELDRARVPWPRTCAEVDTLTLSQRRMRELKAHKLAEVARALGVPLDTAHRATHDAEACGRVLVEMARRFEAPDELDAFIEWADAVGPPPDSGHLVVGERGLPVFVEDPYRGEPVEAHPDHLQWMAIALERRDGRWQPRYPDSVRRWARRWLRVRGAGRVQLGGKGGGSQDWSIEPPVWR